MSWYMTKFLPIYRVALILFIFLLICPSFRNDQSKIHTLPTFVDDSIRVPYSSMGLSDHPSQLRPGDRILKVEIANGYAQWPANREDFVELLSKQPIGSSVEVTVARGSQTVTLTEKVIDHTNLGDLSNHWLQVGVAMGFILFGFLLSSGSRHPVTEPMFFLMLFVGILLLAQLELVISNNPGLLGYSSLTGRVGLFALTTLPASVIHFATRFPIVPERFRSHFVPLSAYCFWIVFGLFAQVRLYDSVFSNAVEIFSYGTVVITLSIQLLVGFFNRSRMSSIEYARARSFAISIGLIIALPIAAFLFGQSSPFIRKASLVGMIALPVSISRDMVLYRLTSPSSWSGWCLNKGTAMSAAAIVVAIAVSLEELGIGGRLLSREGFSALLVVVGVIFGILLARGDVGLTLQSTPTSSRIAEKSLRDFNHTKTQDELIRLVTVLLVDRFHASSVENFSPGNPSTALSRIGQHLWESAGSPKKGIVHMPVRMKDPSSYRAEIAIPLFSDSTDPQLIVAAAKKEGLPYTAHELDALENVSQLASLALGKIISTRILERRIAEKTASIQQSLEDRMQVLHVTQQICEADSVSKVNSLVSSYTSRFHSSQVETVETFGTLAIERLKLVEGLEEEVMKQADEIVRYEKKRQYAQFVRNAAHELRKPTEEVISYVEEIVEAAKEDQQMKRDALRAASELRRRLDLLLFHSDLHLNKQRIDLIQVVDEAFSRISSVVPNRQFSMKHMTPLLPMMGDPSRLLSVFENLIDNAVKATSKGDLVEVRTWIQHGSHAVLHCEIEDKGCGIPKERMETIFEPGISYRAGGYGLGLPLCREIVTRHGGELQVECDDGFTVFHVAIPQIMDTTFPEDRR